MRKAWIGWELVWLLILAIPAMGQVPAEGWERVQGLAAGQEVMVETVGGERITGKLSAATANSLVVGAAKGEKRVGREEVRAVTRRVAPARRKLYAGLGAAGGFVASAASAGLLLYRNCYDGCPGNSAAIWGVLVGAPIGGGVLGYRMAGPGTWQEVCRAN